MRRRPQSASISPGLRFKRRRDNPIRFVRRQDAATSELTITGTISNQCNECASLLIRPGSGLCDLGLWVPTLNALFNNEDTLTLGSSSDHPIKTSTKDNVNSAVTMHDLR